MEFKQAVALIIAKLRFQRRSGSSIPSTGEYLEGAENRILSSSISTRVETHRGSHYANHSIEFSLSSGSGTSVFFCSGFYTLTIGEGEYDDQCEKTGRFSIIGSSKRAIVNVHQCHVSSEKPYEQSLQCTVVLERIIRWNSFHDFMSTAAAFDREVPDLLPRRLLDLAASTAEGGVVAFAFSYPSERKVVLPRPLALSLGRVVETQQENRWTKGSADPTKFSLHQDIESSFFDYALFCLKVPVFGPDNALSILKNATYFGLRCEDHPDILKIAELIASSSHLSVELKIGALLDYFDHYSSLDKIRIVVQDIFEGDCHGNLHFMFGKYAPLALNQSDRALRFLCEICFGSAYKDIKDHPDNDPSEVLDISKPKVRSLYDWSDSD